MAVVPIISQSWDTNSYVNPTRMNNIETNIATLSKATGIEYSTGVSVKEKIDAVANDINFRILSNSYWAWASQTSYSTEVSRNNSVIVYGGRSGVGFLAICPNNNNEIYVIANNTGCTITNAFDSNTGKHTITLSNPTTRVGSSILVTVIG